MLKNYEKSKHDVVNSYYQYVLHTGNDDNRLALKDDTPESPYDASSLSRYVFKSLSYYGPTDPKSFLDAFSKEELRKMKEDQLASVPKYIETLAKFHKLKKSFVSNTIEQYENLLQINGIFVPMSLVDDVISETEDKTRGIIPQVFAAPPKCRLETTIIDTSYIRSISGYTTSPIIKGAATYIEWQDQLHKDEHRFVYIVGSRQIGKSKTLANLVFEESFKPKQKILIASFNSEPTTNMRDYFLEYAENFDDLFVYHKQENYIENTHTGSKVYFRSLSEDARRVRGKTFNLVVVDEAAYVSNDVYDEVLLPTVSTTGGRIIAMSSPDKKNWFYDHIVETKTGRRENSVVYEIDYTRNPFLDDDIRRYVEQRLHSPIIQKEYCCRFLGSGDQLFEANLMEVFPTLNRTDRYVLSYDPARKNDRAGFTLSTITEGRIQTILAQPIPKAQSASWEKQAVYLLKLQQQYDAFFVMDVTGVGDGVIDILRAHGVKVDMAVQYTSGTTETLVQSHTYPGTILYRVGKSRLINNLLTYVENDMAQIYETTCRPLLEEVSYAEYTTTNQGLAAFSSKFYDDVLNAYMIALFATNAMDFINESLRKRPQEEFTGYQEFRSTYRRTRGF